MFKLFTYSIIDVKNSLSSKHSLKSLIIILVSTFNYFLSLSQTLPIFSRFLPTMQILNPSLASSLQNYSPIPSDPPVTTAHPPPYLLIRLTGNTRSLFRSFQIRFVTETNPMRMHKFWQRSYIDKYYIS